MRCPEWLQFLASFPRPAGFSVAIDYGLLTGLSSLCVLKSDMFRICDPAIASRPRLGIAGELGQTVETRRPYSTVAFVKCSVEPVQVIGQAQAAARPQGAGDFFGLYRHRPDGVSGVAIAYFRADSVQIPARCCMEDPKEEFNDRTGKNQKYRGTNHPFMAVARREPGLFAAG